MWDGVVARDGIERRRQPFQGPKKVQLTPSKSLQDRYLRASPISIDWADLAVFRLSPFFGFSMCPYCVPPVCAPLPLL